MASIADVYPPEIWAMESLGVLRNTLVMARLVHRDFENEVASKGDKVNTRKPVEGTAKTWTGQSDTTGLANDEIEVQLPTANAISITLDTLKYTAFLAEDVPATMSIKDIREEFIVPYIGPIAEAVDDDIMTEFCSTSSSDVASSAIDRVADGTVGANAALDEDDIVAARKDLNTNKCPFTGRVIVLGTDHEADLLKSALFVQADQSGSTEALVNANLGRKFGFDFYMSQNVPTADDTDSTPQSLAFHRNAIALVTRPLLQPGEGLGVRSAVQSMDNVGIRVTAGYDIRWKGVVMSFDMLYGVQLLDNLYACIINP